MAARALPVAPTRRPRRWTDHLLLHIVLSVGSIVMLVPFIWMVSTSLKPAGQFSGFIPRELVWENYRTTIESMPFGRFYLNTIITTFFGVTLEVVNAVLTAYALVFLRFPGKNIIFIVMLAALMIPIHVTILPNYLTIASLGWVNTYQGIILPGASVAFGAFLLRQHFLTLPGEIMEAARLDGASNLQTLWHVILPISKPMIVTVTLISLVTKWNDFLWPLISTNSTNMRTLPIGLSYLFNQEGASQWGLIMAATIFVILPVLLIFLRWQKHIVSGLTSGATKG